MSKCIFCGDARGFISLEEMDHVNKQYIVNTLFSAIRDTEVKKGSLFNSIKEAYESGKSSFKLSFCVKCKKILIDFGSGD